MGWIQLGVKLLPFIIDAVNWVEKFVSGKGKFKQDAAVYMIKAGLGVAEQAMNRDVLDDDEVEAATRKVIDAVVALQNLISKKSVSE
tara:strand:- start:498 stop:758 length:261 start_codon:yes stop_codon:yes gene_type:complete